MPGLANGLLGYNRRDQLECRRKSHDHESGQYLGKAYGSINFNGTNNTLPGSPFTIPTMVVNGTYTIGTTDNPR